MTARAASSPRPRSRPTCTTSGTEPADVHLDGDLDLVLADWGPGDALTNGGGPVLLWRNDGGGVFTDVTSTAMPALRVGMSWDLEVADVDQDRDLDVLVSCKVCTGSVLLVNDGLGTFTDASTQLPQAGNNYDFELMDLDGDDDLDAVTINDGPRLRESVWLNDGAGTFVDATATWLPDSENRGLDDNVSCFVDADGDGDADWLIGSLSDPDRVLFQDGGVFRLETDVLGRSANVRDPGHGARGPRRRRADRPRDGAGRGAHPRTRVARGGCAGLDAQAPVVTRVALEADVVRARDPRPQDPGRRPRLRGGRAYAARGHAPVPPRGHGVLGGAPSGRAVLAGVRHRPAGQRGLLGGRAAGGGLRDTPGWAHGRAHRRDPRGAGAHGPGPHGLAAHEHGRRSPRAEGGRLRLSGRRRGPRGARWGPCWSSAAGVRGCSGARRRGGRARRRHADREDRVLVGGGGRPEVCMVEGRTPNRRWPMTSSSVVVSLLLAGCAAPLAPMPEASPSASLGRVLTAGCAGYTTIQGALDAAVDGDVVEVCAGTWSERLTIAGKDLTLRSIGGAAATIVDAQTLGRALRVSGGAVVTVEGFTFRNGHGGAGGNVWCDAATLDLVDSVLHDGVATTGGGLHAGDCDGSVRGTTFHDNVADWRGGGAYVLGGLRRWRTTPSGPTPRTARAAACSSTATAS